MTAIDLATVQIHNSPDIRAWRETATITRIEFRHNGVHIEHTKNLGAGCWPNFRPAGWDGDLQYTLWLVEWIDGQWHASGGMQFWQTCEQNGGQPEHFAEGWFYAADRWGPMTAHQPQPGETVGFLVTAGDARNNGQQTVQERSNLVVIPFPRVGDVYVPAAATDPVPDTLPPTTWAEDVLGRLTALEAAVGQLGDLTTVVHVGASVEATAKVPYIGMVSGKGKVTTTA